MKTYLLKINCTSITLGEDQLEVVDQKIKVNKSQEKLLLETMPGLVVLVEQEEEKKLNPFIKKK